MTPMAGSRSTTTLWGACLLVVSTVLLSGCGGTEGDGTGDSVSRAEANVTSKERALSEAEAELVSASSAFCDASADYIVALDRYGDVLTATAPTVGDVNDAGTDLADPQEEALGKAEDAVQAQEQVVAAKQELKDARAELKAAKNGTEPSPAATPTESAKPLAPTATVNRVKQAETEFEAVQSGTDDQTPLAQASQDFNAAAVALQMSWMQLFADAGCLTDEQQKQAAEAVREYTLALQDALATAGYFDGEIDGVYGPETVDAVESLQKANDLPVTGVVDKATGAALQSDVLAAGGQAAQQELAATAALQQTLKLAGFWDGPVDGIWTPALTQALKDFQTELGVKPTGAVDAATVKAFEKAISEAQQPTESESPAPTETPTTDSPSETPSDS